MYGPNDTVDRIYAAVRGHETRLAEQGQDLDRFEESQPLRWYVLTQDLAAATTITSGGITLTVPGAVDGNPCEWQAAANGGSGGYYVNTSLTHSCAETTTKAAYPKGTWVLCRPMMTPSGALWEVIAAANVDHFAVAQSDWEVNMVAGVSYPRVSVKKCDDMYGTNPQGNAFYVYFYQRGGGYCPAVFASAGSVPGDVITYRLDPLQSRFYCTSPDVYDDVLGTIKYIMLAPSNVTVRFGWSICDGSNPADNKLLDALGNRLALPNTLGLFTRSIELADTLWTGGATEGAATNHPGKAVGAGGRIGVSSSRVADGASGGSAQVVTQLEDVESWKGAPRDGGGITDDAVVCPPCYVLTQIIRYK